MYQEKLLKEILNKIGSNKSIIEEISQALDISYDAAHRRISMKSKFSIEEAAILASHYHISLDKTFHNEQDVLVRKTKEIRNFSDLADYLENSLKALQKFSEGESTSLYYSAKDIPLFYTIQSDILSKFKLYVWMNLLVFDKEEIPFESFQLQAPILQSSQYLKDFYSSINRHEIWNDTTINSTLQQIMYFFQSGLLSSEMASKLCEQLKELISTLEKQCTPKNEHYRLYQHDLLILNNNVLVCNAEQKSLFVPYSMLGYFITEDGETCQNSQLFFQHQLKNSKLINTAGTRDKRMFFNRIYQKIDFYKNQLIAFQEFV